MNKPKKINVFLCDDHPIMVNGLIQIINADPKLHVIGVALTYEETKDSILIDPLPIDLILLDIKLGDHCGMELAQWIIKNYPSIGILFLSMCDDEITIKQAIETGCLAYLPKNIDAEELILAIKTTAKGLNYFPNSVLKSIINHPDIATMPSTKKPSNGIQLSERESQVLTLILKGESSKKIGESLFLSVHTVNTYKKALFKKFDVNNVTSLVVKALNGK